MPEIVGHVQEGVWPVMLTPFTDSGEIDWHGVDALVEWYIEAGVVGLFAVCLSSEMYHLSPDERLRLAAHVVARAAGRLPVIVAAARSSGAGAFGGSVLEQADRVRRIADTGAAAVVLTVNQLAGEGEPDTVWQRNAAAILELCEGIPLGLYECPQPYHRLLGPALLGWAARSGGFHFLKDTCCRRDEIRAKLEAVRGTSLSWYNANCPTLLFSLREGAQGYSGVAANFYPELFVRLCADFAVDAEAAERLQRFLTVADMAIRHRYPANAKRYLGMLGLPIGTTCRVPVRVPDRTDDEALALLALSESVAALKAEG
jgi:4-hydroxy-tetrahydrodipicolinate synthase